MPLKAFVGLRRISQSTPLSQAQSTRSARDSMKQIVKNLQSVINSIEGATPDAIEYGLMPIFEESQTLVPVDTGNLKRSGYLEVEQHGSKIEAEIGYGKGGTPFYAVYVHENLENHHNPPTQAKFLEEAINRHFNEVGDRICNHILSEVWGSGGGSSAGEGNFAEFGEG